MTFNTIKNLLKCFQILQDNDLCITSSLYHEYNFLSKCIDLFMHCGSRKRTKAVYQNSSPPFLLNRPSLLCQQRLFQNSRINQLEMSFKVTKDRSHFSKLCSAELKYEMSNIYNKIFRVKYIDSLKYLRY